MAEKGPIWVKWVDSATHDQTWKHPEDIKFGETLCESVGWVIRKDKKTLYLAGDRSESCVARIMQIPLVAIRQQRRLK